MDFRRWITALAVVALFAGLASAQVSPGNPAASAFLCNLVGQVTPTVRTEGITELVGDIVIQCSGGTPPAAGSAIPQANVFVTVTAPVTSRGTGTTPSASEALFLIDEPQSTLTGPVPGYGPYAPQKVCPTPNAGCPAVAASVGGQIVAQDGDGAPAHNVFQGLASGNTVQFLGVPILPPGTAAQRMYRITNIRVNATGLGSTIVSGISQIQAYISTNGASSIPLTLAQLTVAFAQTSLSTSLSGTTTLTQCNPANQVRVGTLRYRETFANAFKTRVIPRDPAVEYSSMGGGGVIQYVPGAIAASESGLVMNGAAAGLGGTLSIGTVPAGLANSGTRFQAVFSNFPSGASIYVSKYNTNTTLPALVGTAMGPGVNQPNVAVMTTGGAAGDFVEAVSTSKTIGTLVQVQPGSDGTATVVWEVANTNTSSVEDYDFGVYISYTPNASLTTPTLGQSLFVNLNYAPIGTQTSPNWIPRFLRTPTQHTIVNIIPCQTILLFPYVTSANGFDTGIAISNTAEDPFGTRTAVGYCKMYFYGTNAPQTPTATCAGSTSALCMGPLGPVNSTATPAVAPTGAMLASSAAVDFTGYVFAVCDFQFAHGFAFVSDVGARNLAMGYLALIMSDPAADLWNIRNGEAAGEKLNN